MISPLASARSLYRTINDNFGTIVFCRRYLERLGVERYLAGVSILAILGWNTRSHQADEQPRISRDRRGPRASHGY